MKLVLEQLSSPIGSILVAEDPESGSVYALDFEDRRPRLTALLERRFGPVDLVPGAALHAAPIRSYFAGELDALAEVPAVLGGTPFQARVWQALREIAPGTTLSYSALAGAIGSPGCARAVGAANARNPIALIVPCHRIVGSDGTLTGYAGGLERKRWLLTHEGALQSGDA